MNRTNRENMFWTSSGGMVPVTVASSAEEEEEGFGRKTMGKVKVMCGICGGGWAPESAVAGAVDEAEGGCGTGVSASTVMMIMRIIAVVVEDGGVERRES